MTRVSKMWLIFGFEILNKNFELKINLGGAFSTFGVSGIISGLISSVAALFLEIKTLQ